MIKAPIVSRFPGAPRREALSGAKTFAGATLLQRQLRKCGLSLTVSGFGPTKQVILYSAKLYDELL